MTARMLGVALVVAIAACAGGFPDPKPIDPAGCSSMAAHLDALGCRKATDTQRQCEIQLREGLRINLECLRSVRSCQEIVSCK